MGKGVVAVKVSEMISEEIAGMQGYDAALALGEMSYSGWLHESRVWLGKGGGEGPGGWQWEVRSDLWQDGAVVSTTRARMVEGMTVWSRDVAAAQCAVAISAILESRGGVACQENEGAWY